jgi:hypothetical protein
MSILLSSTLPILPPGCSNSLSPQTCASVYNPGIGELVMNVMIRRRLAVYGRRRGGNTWTIDRNPVRAPRTVETTQDLTRKGGGEPAGWRLEEVGISA